MPLIQVFTSVAAPPAAVEETLHAELTRVLTEYLRKPKQWMMTRLVPDQSMTFAGTRAPACLASLKSVGTMAPEITAGLSDELCTILEKALKVPRDRIYVDFQDVEPHLWGWNGGTFA